MSDIVLVAIVGVVGVLGTGVLAPMVLGFLNARTAEAKEERDYARQDEVAKRAAEATKAATDAATAAAAAVLHVADVAREARIEAAENALKLIGKVDVVHTLVNSQMTTALQAEYDATSRELALMVEVAELRHAAHPGIATPGVDRAIALTNERLLVLADGIEVRRRAAETVVEQQKAQAADATAAAGTDRIVDAIQALPGQGAEQGSPIVTRPATP